MTPVNLDELERIARAATPGEWKQLGATVVVEPYRTIQCFGAIRRGPDGTNASLSEDAAYIASFNPSVALELIRLARLGDEVSKERERVIAKTKELERYKSDAERSLGLMALTLDKMKEELAEMDQLKRDNALMRQALRKIAEHDTLDGEKYPSYTQAYFGVAEYAQEALAKVTVEVLDDGKEGT